VSRARLSLTSFSLPSLLFSYIDGYRIGGEEILVRSMSVSRQGGPTQIGPKPEIHPRPGDASRGEKGRHPRRWDHTRRSRHLLDTAWACRVPRTQGTQHCTLLGAVPRRVVSPAGCATLWPKPIACDSNRHKGGSRGMGREDGNGLWHLSARDECNRKRIII